MGFRDREKNRIPVNIDEELIVKIETIGAKGDGIVKIKGYTLFAPDTEVGKTYRIKITKTLERFGFAEMLEEIENE